MDRRFSSYKYKYKSTIGNFFYLPKGCHKKTKRLTLFLILYLAFEKVRIHFLKQMKQFFLSLYFLTEMNAIQ